tara:strand:+ start:1493 stop:1786 length:294 start_codon:yes stop_codon:yes gene_type:complete
MKIFLLILLLILLRLLNDIKEKWSGPTKSFISKDLSNCNDIDQNYGGDISDYNLSDGIGVIGCNFGNTFVAIGKTFSNTFQALDNSIELGEDIVNMA